MTSETLFRDAIKKTIIHIQTFLGSVSSPHLTPFFCISPLPCVTANLLRKKGNPLLSTCFLVKELGFNL